MASAISLTTGQVFLVGWSGTVTGGTIALGEGSQSNPTFTFSAFPTSGLFDISGVPQLSVLGVNSYVFGATTFQTNTAILTNGSVTIPIASSFLVSTATTLGAKLSKYNSVSTAGWGLGAVQGQATTGTVTNAGTASIATYTNGAADGIFQVSADVSVTTSSAHSFSIDVVYTDASNTSRTMSLPINQLGAAFIASGLITNVTGVGPYESAVIQIRAKASTSITIRTSSGGTFTGVVYTANGSIIQVG